MCRSDSTSSLDGRDLELPFKRPWPPRGHSLERSAASRTSMGPLRSSTGATTLLSAALLACPGCLCSRASSHPLAVTLSPPCCRLSGTGHEVSAWLAERLTTILGGIDGFSVYCTRCCVVPLRARRQCVSLAAVCIACGESVPLPAARPDPVWPSGPTNRTTVASDVQMGCRRVAWRSAPPL